MRYKNPKFTYIDSQGYRQIRMPDHPRAHRGNGYVFEHILVAENALGKFLPPGAVIHHVNEVRSENRNDNLVICQDAIYHSLIHRRKRIVDAGGDPDAHRICSVCKRCLLIECFSKNRASADGINAICKVCGNAAAKRRRESLANPAEKE